MINFLGSTADSSFSVIGFSSIDSVDSLDPYVVMLYWSLKQKTKSLRINRAWLHKDLKGLDFQQTVE